MSKSPQYIDELVEAHFRQIQKILRENYHVDYSIDYIRKVCKGKRNNFDIYRISRKYLNFLKLMDKKMKEL